MTTTTHPSTVRRLAAAACTAALLLTGCTQADDEPVDPRGATAGVLTTDDLGQDWTGPWWDVAAAQKERDPEYPRFEFRCDVPLVPSGGAGDAGREAYARAAWSTGEHGEVIVWSQAARYDYSRYVDDVLTKIEDRASGCAAWEPVATEVTSVVTVTGTPQAPVLDEVYRENTPRAWHIRTTWTTTDDDIVVMLTIGWRPGHDPHLDHEALLATAVERAATLPETTNDPWPS